jgi:hypothetical protein
LIFLLSLPIGVIFRLTQITGIPFKLPGKFVKHTDVHIHLPDVLAGQFLLTDNGDLWPLPFPPGFPEAREIQAHKGLL